MAVTIKVRSGNACRDEAGRQRVAEGKAGQGWITGRLRSHTATRRRGVGICGIDSLMRVRPVEVLQVFRSKARGKLPSQETNRLVGMKVCHSRQRLDPSLHHEAGLASGAGSDGKIYGIGCSTTGSRINNGHDRTAGGCDVAGDDLRGEEIWVLNERLSALRSEEHTSELQSRLHLVCRLLL